MIFHMPKKETQILTLKIDNTNIDKVAEFNLLGLTIDTHKTDTISNKCSKITGILNRLECVFPQEI